MCLPTEGRTREGRGVRLETEKFIRFSMVNNRNDQNGVWNRNFAGLIRDRWIVEFSNKGNSQRDSTRRKLEAFG